MSSVDRIAQLKVTKQFIRLCKNGKIYCNNSTNITDTTTRLAAATSLTESSVGAGPGLIHVDNNTPISLEEFLRRKNGFTLKAPPIEDSPKFKHVRILELDNKWKYWIPTKNVKVSSEDIVLSEPSVGLGLPKIIPLPTHASSSFSREEMLKLCKQVRFQDDQIMYYEKRKLPKEIRTGSAELSPKQIQKKIESHLSPGEVKKSCNLESITFQSKQRKDTQSILSDCILLFSENKNSPEYRFYPGKKCSPERMTLIANCISSEINSLGVPGTVTDFSIYEKDMHLLLVKLSGRRVLAKDLQQYKMWNAMLRSWLATKMEVIPSILKLQTEIDKGKINVRWRVKTLTTFFSLSVLLMKDKESYYSYVDFHSEFFINDEGQIYCHVISRMEPTKSGQRLGKTAKLSTLAAGLFGLSGLDDNNCCLSSTSATFYTSAVFSVNPLKSLPLITSELVTQNGKEETSLVYQTFQRN